MIRKVILLILPVFYIAVPNLFAQDVLFSQWESMSLHFNPAKAGNFEGSLRFRAKTRNQWESVLGPNSYKTNAAAIEYKFAQGGKRKFSAGFHTLFDRAGGAQKSQSYNLTASVIQNLGNPEKSHHTLALGFSGGIVGRQIDLNNLQWSMNGGTEDLNSAINFADLSVGLNWRYMTNSHFSFQLGSALHHVNKPNISFDENFESKLYQRFNFHANVELPVADKISIIPSILYFEQGPSNQFFYGFYSKWYLGLIDNNSAQIGFFAKASNSLSGSQITAYVLSASVELKSILLGFSIDRFRLFKSYTYEFSVGYTFGRVSGFED